MKFPARDHSGRKIVGNEGPADQGSLDLDLAQEHAILGWRRLLGNGGHDSDAQQHADEVTGEHDGPFATLPETALGWGKLDQNFGPSR